MSSQVHVSNLDLNDLLSSNDQNIPNFNPTSVNTIGGLESKYYTPDQFNNEVLPVNGSNTCMPILHINCRSLKKNFDTITDYLYLLKVKFDFILLSETWLSGSPDQLLSLDGYDYYGESRQSRGGGVGIYARNVFKIIKRPDICIFNENIESHFLEVTQSNGKNVIIAVVYRPPSQSITNFVTELGNVLEKIDNENKICYFLGDFNLNLFEIHSDQHVNSFIELFFSYSFVPLITKATRITPSSATLIDNVFVNDINRVFRSGILMSDISDHLPIFLICKSNQRINSNVQQTYYKRDMSHSNIDKFRNTLAAHCWESVLRKDSCDSAYEVFLSEFNLMYNSCIPLKEMRSKKKKPLKPWITPAILKSCKKKIKLYKKYLKYPSEYRKTMYRKYRNILNTVIRKSKEDYYTKQFEESNTCKQTWNIINNILNKNTERKTHRCFCDENNQTFTNSTDIAEKFNEFFINIGTMFTNPQDIDLTKCKSYMRGLYKQSMFLKPIEAYEIADIVKSMKTGTSPGHDKLTVSIIKEAIDYILVPLEYIFNLSFSTGKFPQSMKLARVTPIYKKGSHDQFSNYRPVSVLPVLSKILERLFYSRLLSYVGKWGYCQTFSTDLDPVIQPYWH